MAQSLVGLFGFAVLGLATAMPIMADTRASVDGRVLSGVTKAPLAATLTVADHSGYTVHTRTDRNGRFSAIGLEPGSVTVSFDVAGYESQVVSCTVPAGETGRFELRAFRRRTNVSDTSYRCALEPSLGTRYIIQ
jgi:hypothetical protein